MGFLINKKCRKKPSAVDRTDVSDVDRTDRLHRQSTFCPTHCAAGDAAPGRGTAGFNIVHALGHMGVVVSTGHACCCTQGPWDMYPLGHPGGEPQPHHFEWRTNVFSHAPHLCMPSMSKLACVDAGVLCVLVHVDRNWCGCPVLLHLIMEHTCKHTLGLCG